jgi:hypothetical protein
MNIAIVLVLLHCHHAYIKDTQDKPLLLERYKKSKKGQIMENLPLIFIQNQMVMLKKKIERSLLGYNRFQYLLDVLAFLSL